MENITAIKDIVSARKRLKKQLYHEVWHQTSRQAMSAAEAGQMATRIKIPLYRTGYPPFEHAPLVNWVARQFKLSGLAVRPCDGGFIVSWENLDGEAKRSSGAGPAAFESDFSSLVNLKSVARSLREK